MDTVIIFTITASQERFRWQPRVGGCHHDDLWVREKDKEQPEEEQETLGAV